MKKVFYVFISVLISVLISSCSNEASSEAKKKLEEIKKYDQISLTKGETSVDVYVKANEQPDAILDIANFFYISFIDKNAPEYTGERFLNHPDSKLTEKGELINKPLRHYTVYLNKGEKFLDMNLNRVITTQRTIYIHYIYE